VHICGSRASRSRPGRLVLVVQISISVMVTTVVGWAVSRGPNCCPSMLGTVSDRVEQHIRLFNEAVRQADWAPFLATFASDAVMTFDGAPVGPYVGLAEIARAYASRPPSDTMTVLSVTRDRGDDIVRFAWDAGGGGTLRISWREGAIVALAVTFDR
jgi:steroid Delta-isomerase